MREQFYRNIENEEVFLEVDVDIFERKNEFTSLFSVFIKVDLDPSNEEAYESFLETKESLILALEYEEQAIYVGMRYIDGWVELYFYTTHAKNLQKDVGHILSPMKLSYESNSVKDAKWDFYINALYPNELEFCYIQASHIIGELEEEEDDLSVEREVEHYIVFDTATQKERFVENILACGYKYKDDIATDTYDHGVVITNKSAVDLSSIKKSIDEIFEHAKKEHGFYEGWSTTLANEV